MTLSQIGAMSEADARAYLESIRWPDGTRCPHCGSEEVTRLQGKAHRPGVFKCRACRKQFTVTVGTIFESSHIPLQKWIMAFHLLCSSKKGVSSLQLQRELGLGCYRTALFMTHRIREAMTDNGGVMLEGFVEADETYVGGKPRPNDGKLRKDGRGTSKTPVAVVVERNGDAQARVVFSRKEDSLKGFVRHNVDPMAVILTDELNAYTGLDEDFTGHLTVNHSSGEYARRVGGFSINTNTAESFFSLLKRGHYGVYHQMSKHHLNRYCEEFAFRWDHRKCSDARRTVAALAGAEGKRLKYRAMVGRPARLSEPPQD